MPTVRQYTRKTNEKKNVPIDANQQTRPALRDITNVQHAHGKATVLKGGASQQFVPISSEPYTIFSPDPEIPIYEDNKENDQKVTRPSEVTPLTVRVARDLTHMRHHAEEMEEKSDKIWSPFHLACKDGLPPPSHASFHQLKSKEPPSTKGSKLPRQRESTLISHMKKLTVSIPPSAIKGEVWGRKVPLSQLQVDEEDHMIALRHGK